MIHLNYGHGKGEWITEFEFKKRYPKFDNDFKPAPLSEECEAYRDLRIKKRITMRGMAKRIKIKISELTNLEHGRIKITSEIREKWQMALSS